MTQTPESCSKYLCATLTPPKKKRQLAMIPSKRTAPTAAATAAGLEGRYGGRDGNNDHLFFLKKKHTQHCHWNCSVLRNICGDGATPPPLPQMRAPPSAPPLEVGSELPPPVSADVRTPIPMTSSFFFNSATIDYTINEELCTVATTIQELVDATIGLKPLLLKAQIGSVHARGKKMIKRGNQFISEFMSVSITPRRTTTSSSALVRCTIPPSFFL